MNLFDALANWATGLVTSVVVTALGLGSIGAPAASPDVSTSSGILAWAQDVDEQTIQQVGEEAQAEGADAETLDAGSPPAEGASESLSSSEAALSQTSGDVELLDQGSPTREAATVANVETTTVETPAPATMIDGVASAPSSDAVVTEPAVNSGPQLPEGFGEGQTLVSTAAGDFPPGLDECHVGAVTGRAYVGLDCNEDGSTFVGHAPTFEEFPFVTDEDFPFENDDPIVADENFPFGDDGPTPAIELNSNSDTSTNVLVAAGGRREGPSVNLPDGSEGAVIERAQRATNDAATGQADRKSKRNRSTSLAVDASSGNSSDRVQAAAKNSNESKREKSTSSKENTNGKAKQKQKTQGKEKNKDSKNNNKKKSKGKKESTSKKGKKENRKKNR